MARGNTPFIAFNRGLISEKALARVDLDRTRLSASLMNNWLPKTQGNMTIRPGTKKVGNSFNDSGSTWVEFVAATDDVALVELTNDTGLGGGIGGTSRYWVGSDGHELSLIERVPVTATLSLGDTGWDNTSVGGTGSVTNDTDILPTFTSRNEGNHRVDASSEWNGAGISGNDDYAAWRAVSDNLGREWFDTGVYGGSHLPSWFQIDFAYYNDTGTADTGLHVSPTGYTLRAADKADWLDEMPGEWRLLSSNYDTGTYNTDTGKWTMEDEQTNVTTWAVSEKKSYTLPGVDTGTIDPKRFWRWHITLPSSMVADRRIIISEFELLKSTNVSQFALSGGKYTLNAQAIGSIARGQKRVMVAAADTGKEHALQIHIERGPVSLRVGSTANDDDIVNETALGTGYHNLAFNPVTDFHITVQSKSQSNRIIGSMSMSDTGTLQVRTPWTAGDLGNIRYDQSADVIFADCKDVAPKKIERRGTGRSWSVVEYQPNDGPIQLFPSSGAKISSDGQYGNVTLTSDIPFFSPSRVGSLVRMFYNGQTGVWLLGAEDAITESIEVTGIGDTGAATSSNERRIVFTQSGTYEGGFVIERSFDGFDIGFKQVTDNSVSGGNGTSTDTGTRTATIDDAEDNIKVWYRARMSPYTSGAGQMQINYRGGSTTGIARITEYVSTTQVKAEVINRIADTGGIEVDQWEEGYWSDHAGYPTSVALHGGRLYHAQGGSIFGSVADDFESYNDETEGDAAPIIRTLGSGPVDNIHYLVSLLRLIIGTSGAEIALRSSSLDEPLTPENSNARTFSTQGSANLRAIKMDTNAIFVQRSGQRVFLVGFGLEGDALGDYKNSEMTFLVPDLLSVGIASIAIQRQPDTRIHLVLNDGTVAILTYEPEEEVLAWSTWSTDTGTDSVVEQAAVLPGTAEDAVFYQIKRTINGTTSRFLEKWAKESECLGDTGLHWLMDCATSYTDTGRTNVLQDIATHLVGQTCVGWGSLDSGSTPHIDLSPDSEGVQQLLTVDTGGSVTLTYTEGVHHAVVGLPYKADWRSSKLAYGAEAGTALTQMKRTDKIGFVLMNTHNNALLFGNDTGQLDPMPRMNEEEGLVDQDLIFDHYDQHAIPFPGLWDEDSRIYLRAVAPRPANILALVPTIGTNEKV